MKNKYTAVVLLFLLLTSCGQQPEETAIAATETTAAVTETAATVTETAAAATSAATETAAAEAFTADGESRTGEEFLGGWLSEDGSLILAIVSDGSRFMGDIQESSDSLEPGVLHTQWSYQNAAYQDGKLVCTGGEKSTYIWLTENSGKSDVVYSNGKAEFICTPEGILWKNLTEEDMPDILFNEHLAD